MIATTRSSPFGVADLLNRAVEAAQPTREQHERAFSSYHHVGEWVCDPDGRLGPFRPRYSPQGSFVYGTVVRPLWQHEFDVDALTRMEIDPYNMSADEAYTRLAARISEHGDLAKRMELMPRCVRLNYAGDFHHDATPACQDPRPGRALLIPAKKEERLNSSAWASWKSSDPFGYATWFSSKNLPVLESRMLAGVDPAPRYEPASEKTPLRKIVQLTKMRRNRFYRPEGAPSSILITTMAAECYCGQPFTLEANIEVVAQMSSWAEREGENLSVPHPTLPEDDFAAGMGSDAKAHFREFLRTYLKELVAMSGSRGIHRITDSMRDMYEGPVAESAVRSMAETVQTARANKTLHVGRRAAPLVVVASKAAGAATNVMPRANRDHSFHGGPIEE